MERELDSQPSLLSSLPSFAVPFEPQKMNPLVEALDTPLHTETPEIDLGQSHPKRFKVGNGGSIPTPSPPLSLVFFPFRQLSVS